MVSSACIVTIYSHWLDTFTSVLADFPKRQGRLGYKQFGDIMNGFFFFSHNFLIQFYDERTFSVFLEEVKYPEKRIVFKKISE